MTGRSNEDRQRLASELRQHGRDDLATALEAVSESEASQRDVERKIDALTAAIEGQQRDVSPEARRRAEQEAEATAVRHALERDTGWKPEAGER